MRLFYSKANAVIFFVCLYFIFLLCCIQGRQGMVPKTEMTLLPQQSSLSRAAGTKLGETPVFSRKSGTWGVVIKGENASLLQPALKIDPIRPLTRSPRGPSTHGRHHSTMPRTSAWTQTGNSNRNFFILHDREPGTILSQ